MADITTRETSGGGATVKGSPLTNSEVDTNFINLNADKVESGGDATLADVTVDSLQFTGGTGTQGTVSWNVDEETLDVILDGATLQMGQEVHYHVRNNTASTISNGTPVMVTGTLGASGRLTIAPMDATDQDNAIYYIGVTTEDIAANADGKATHFGKIRHLDTSAYADGDLLWLSTSTVGAFTTTEPSTGIKIPAAIVIKSHAQNGTLFCRYQGGYGIHDMHDFDASVTPVDNDVVAYDATSGNYQPQSAAEAGLATAAQGSLADTALQPADLTVTTNAAGTAALTYTSGTGVFSYTPPDLSSYLTSYTETDPVFTASPAGGITTTDINNWNTAYGWGDHASAGYLTTETDSQTLTWTGATGVLSISNGNSVDLDGRYLTSYTETDTLDSVTDRGATTTNAITVGNLTSTGIDDNATSTKLTVSDAGIDVTGTADVDGTVNSRGLQAKGSPSLSFNASNWMTQQETGVARTYICGPDASTYQPWEIYRATSTGGASLTMTLDASGNVGIGTTSPTAVLHIQRNSPTTYFYGNACNEQRPLTITSSTTNNNGDTHTFNVASSSGVIAFATYNTERARIDSNGSLILSPAVAANPKLIQNCSNNTAAISFRSAGVERGNIYFLDSGVSYNTTSDYRVKENVVDLDNGIDRLKQIPVHRFNFIANPDTTVDGFIAHEVQDVVPEAITGTKDAVDAEGNPEYQGIDQSKLVPLLTAALQEAVTRIETLEAEVAALKGA